MQFKRYRRGQFIIVRFNDSLGAELKGTHPAIVLTKNDSPKNQKLTILPLSSKFKKYYIDLGEIISTDIIEAPLIKEMGKLISRGDDVMNLTESEKIFFEKSQLNMTTNEIAEFFISDNMNREEAIKYVNGISFQLILRTHELNAINDEIKKVTAMYKRYKSFLKRSYGLIHDITTISKIRIIKKDISYDPLNNLIVSKDILDMIDETIIKTYTKNS